ncbi:MAG TPA: hypothetical protein VNA20_07685 [Frankiaceae bacterium]|nr:hypothetical protein [Frankiaceae bacterium]
MPNPSTGARGMLSLSIRATSDYTSMFVKGVCWIDMPQHCSVEAVAQGPNPNVGAGRDTQVPSDMILGRICVRLEAVWSSGITGDATDIRECTSGVSGTVGGIHVDIPFNA